MNLYRPRRTRINQLLIVWACLCIPTVGLVVAVVGIAGVAIHTGRIETHEHNARMAEARTMAFQTMRRHGATSISDSFSFDGETAVGACRMKSGRISQFAIVYRVAKWGDTTTWEPLQVTIDGEPAG